MKRTWLVSACAVPVVAAGFYLQQRRVDDVPTDSFLSWPPSPAAVRATVARAGAGKSGPASVAAEEAVFAKQFQGRYRQHDPAMAVGLHFARHDTVRLLTPARMEPWNLDRLALTAWKETRANFGHSFKVDIYETFIGTAPIKIGTLRALKSHGDGVQIAYNYPAVNREH